MEYAIHNRRAITRTYSERPLLSLLRIYLSSEYWRWL